MMMMMMLLTGVVWSGCILQDKNEFKHPIKFDPLSKA